MLAEKTASCTITTISFKAHDIQIEKKLVLLVFTFGSEHYKQNETRVFKFTDVSWVARERGETPEVCVGSEG